MDEKSLLVRKRGQIKAKLTLFRKFLEDWTPDKGTRLLQVKLAKIEASFSDFVDIQYQIELLDDDVSQQAEGHFIEQTYDEVISAGGKLLETITPLPETKLHPDEALQPLSTLPKIKIPEFDGNLDDWLSFQSLFKSLIIDNDKINDTQKLFYLKSVLRGPAAHLIDAIELTQRNFSVAWKILLDRYHNEPLIVENLMKGLFEQSKLDRESVVELRKLIENTERNLQLLSTLGQPIQAWDTVLVYLIESKLDPITRRAWRLEHKQKTLATYKELIDFLKVRCNTLEVTHPVAKSSTTKQKKNPFRKGKIDYSMKQTYVMTQHECSVCKSNHELFQCQAFKNMDVEQRINIVK